MITPYKSCAEWIQQAQERVQSRAIVNLRIPQNMGNPTTYATMNSRGILLYEILFCPKQIYNDDHDDDKTVNS
jgi:hypothetical protein